MAQVEQRSQMHSKQRHSQIVFRLRLVLGFTQRRCVAVLSGDDPPRVAVKEQLDGLDSIAFVDFL